MTAPDTNIEKQKTRHRPSLAGIAAVVALIGIFVLGAFSLNVGNDGAADFAPAVPTEQDG